MREFLGDDDKVMFFRDENKITIEFKSPLSLARWMLKISHAREQEGSGIILEPSAGTGAMLAPLLEQCRDTEEIDPQRIVAVEENELLAKILREKYPDIHVICADFVKRDRYVDDGDTKRFMSGAEIVRRNHGLVRYVLMNPPFYGLGPESHVYTAMSLLEKGGNLVSVLPILDMNLSPNQSFVSALHRDFEHVIFHNSTSRLFSHGMGVGVETQVVACVNYRHDNSTRHVWHVGPH